MGAWSRRRKILTAVAALVGLWLVVVLYLVVDAWLALRDGTDALRDVRRQATISDLLDPGTIDDVDHATQRFEEASDRLDSILLAPIRVVPVASRHLAAARRVAHGSRDGARAADRALGELGRLVERPRRTGPERIQILRDLAAVAGRAAAGLDRIDVGSSAGLQSSVGAAVEELRTERDDARRGASRLRAVSLALVDVLQGPDPYLLLGANNAEMRNDSGMFLSAATLRLDHGELDLGDVQPTADTVLAKGAVPVTGDLHRNWPWLDPGRDLRNLGLTADFPQSARLAVANWAKVPGGAKTAGVIVVDVDGVRALLRVVGPVTVDGVGYTADNVRGELLREQYRRYKDDRDARRDRLGQVAREIFDRLESGRFEVDRLASELSDAVQGRHLLVWSVDPEIQRAWRDVGADGHLTDRSLSVALLNRSAEKLDSWIDTAAEVTSAPASGGRTRLTLTYRITNGAPGSGPAYLVGPNVAGLRAGDHRGLVVVHLPQGATDVAMDGAKVFLEGEDGPTHVIGGELTIRRGAKATVTVTALVPRGVGEVVLEPSARIDHTIWTVDGERFDRERRRTVRIG